MAAATATGFLGQTAQAANDRTATARYRVDFEAFLEERQMLFDTMS